MQYMLTPEEFDSLIEDRSKLKKAEKLLATQELCTLIADTMPIKVNWKDEIEPHGCQLHIKSDRCCFDCPVLNICPSDDKDFSK